VPSVCVTVRVFCPLLPMQLVLSEAGEQSASDEDNDRANKNYCRKLESPADYKWAGSAAAAGAASLPTPE